VLGESRARVLETIQNSPTPLGVADIAARVGRHANSVRFHLDGLLEQGLIERTSEGRDIPGRPRTLYTATPDAPHAGRRSYRLLAQILTDYLAAHVRNPRKAALEAGEQWGRRLGERPARSRRVTARAATRELVDKLDQLGFAPEPVTSGRRRQILLHHCPFREAAEQHQSVVCTVHLGLMRGMLDELDAPVAATGLDPLVEPDLCIAHLASRTSDERASID
jgi:predicted ArsR family transcriptional regulator